MSATANRCHRRYADKMPGSLRKKMTNNEVGHHRKSLHIRGNRIELLCHIQLRIEVTSAGRYYDKINVAHVGHELREHALSVIAIPDVNSPRPRGIRQFPWRAG